MEPIAATLVGPSPAIHKPEENVVEPLQFGEKIHRLMTVPSKSASSFTALLELPATKAMELLHAPESSDNRSPFSDEAVCKPFLPSVNGNLTFPSNAALFERAAKFPVCPSNSSANLERVKNEPLDIDCSPESSQPLTSDPTVEGKSQRSTKRKEREKKGKSSTKKRKNESAEDAEKLPYVHVRARRGQATDSHSLAERARREKINARMKLLQELVPGCNKISGTALVLDEIINHVQSLQSQVEFLSMRLATVNPRIDFTLESVLAEETMQGGSLMESEFPTIVMPSTWPEVQVSGNRQQYQHQWFFDTIQQPLWGREEDNHNFIAPDQSLLSYDSSLNSASLHSNQSKIEL